MPSDRVIWTIGHSTRSLADFLELLQGSAIEVLADVRRFPGSKRFPHFNAEVLAGSLATAGVAYRHFPDLGGRRGSPVPDSPNTAWRVEAFNAYADHMASPPFLRALDELNARASLARVAIMCSEAVPWRCHRRLIADALTIRGWTVLDMLAPNKVESHKLTDFAQVDGIRLTYPAEPLFGGP